MNEEASLPNVGETTTAERLRAAAWAIVRDEGIAAATSRRITEVAGTNLGAITYHFRSKDALLGDAVAAQLRNWTEPLTTALVRDPDGDIEAYDGAVSAAIATVMSRFLTDTKDVDTVVSLLISSPHLPGVRASATRWLKELRAVASEAMVRQQAMGHVPESVDPVAMAAVFTAFALGLAAQSAIDETAPPTTTVVAEFLNLLVRPTANASDQRPASRGR